jgi:hypothetical protein
MITLKNSQLSLEQKFECPEEFDRVSFEKAIEAYKYQAKETKETPVIEFIFENVARYIEVTTFEEVKRKMHEDNKNNPGVSPRDVEEIAERSASEAIDRLSEGLYQEIILMLKSQNLAFKSMSMSSSGADGIINSPQVSVIGVGMGVREFNEMYF